MFGLAIKRLSERPRTISALLSASREWNEIIMKAQPQLFCGLMVCFLKSHATGCKAILVQSVFGKCSRYGFLQEPSANPYSREIPEAFALSC
jgi:hypothetical protein